MGDPFDTAVRNLILKAGLEPDETLRAFLKPIVISGHLDPEEELERWKFLRDLFGDFSTYDVFVAHDISQKPDESNILLYEAIGDLCNRLGHKAFLPYAAVGFPGDKHEMQPRDAYVLINDIMVPKTELVIAYIGIQSADVGAMTGRAKIHNKPIIYVCEKENERNALELYDYHKVVGFVKFNDLEDCLLQIEADVRKFFEQENKRGSAPLN